MGTDILDKLEEKIEAALCAEDPAEQLERADAEVVSGGRGVDSNNSIIDDDPIVLPEI